MMTAEQYRSSLDDGRETYFEGEQVDNVANHKILGITVDSVSYTHLTLPTICSV